MVAPTPVSALLHAVAVVKAGVFTMLMVIVYIFGIDFLSETGGSRWLAYVSGFTILASSVVAITKKDDIKGGACLFNDQSAVLYRVGAALATAAAIEGGCTAYRHACFGKNHIVLLCRCDLCERAS